MSSIYVIKKQQEAAMISQNEFPIKILANHSSSTFSRMNEDTKTCKRTDVHGGTHVKKNEKIVLGKETI